jgi:hypothetical protein
MRGRIALAALALVWTAAAASAQEGKTQAVGVAPVTKQDPSPRDSALRAAVRTAVAEAAASMLSGGAAPPAPTTETPEADPNAWLAEKLGPDPFVYVTRFRIVEDRGSRPAMFSTDKSVETEYVVLAEVNLNLDAIRARMEKLGLAAQQSARGPSRQVLLVVEGLTSYPPLAAVRKTLERERGVRSVQPVEFSAGRAVLSVDADQDASALVASLSRRAPEGLRVVPVEDGPTRAIVRVEWQPPAPTQPGPVTPTANGPAAD